jgi:hypothetical protein
MRWTAGGDSAQDLDPAWSVLDATGAAAFGRRTTTTVIALGGTPGKAYQPDGWELWGPLNPLYEAGE